MTSLASKPFDKRPIAAFDLATDMARELASRLHRPTTDEIRDELERMLLIALRNGGIRP